MTPLQLDIFGVQFRVSGKWRLYPTVSKKSEHNNFDWPSWKRSFEFKDKIPCEVCDVMTSEVELEFFDYTYLFVNYF